MAHTEFEVSVEGATLAAKISLPSGERHAPALVALHGADEGLRDWHVYEHLHEVLPPTGVAAITFDRRGEGRSTGESSRGQIRRQAEDALAVIECVADIAPVSAEQIGLWGISQGAWAAPLAATLSSRVAFLVLVASAGVSPGDQMRWAVEKHVTHDYGADAGEQAARIWSLALDWIRGGDRGPLELAAADAKTQPWWGQVSLPANIPPDEARRQLAEELTFDPEPIFAAVRVPVLLVYGDADEWIPVNESVAVWKRACPSAEVLVVPGMAHVPAVDEAIAPEYERAMVDWLHHRAE